MAVDMGFNRSVVLLTLDKPTIVEVMPVTVPVKAGDADFAYGDRDALVR